jgi:hypothetical protein
MARDRERCLLSRGRSWVRTAQNAGWRSDPGRGWRRWKLPPSGSKRSCLARTRLRAFVQHAGRYTPEEATRVAAIHLPDVLPYQPGCQASSPSNGRALTDDAAAYFLSVLTNGKVSGDGLKPHSDLLAEFPCVGPPHNVT